MSDFRRLLQYLRPYWVSFTVALVAMAANGIFEGAVGALIVPIFEQLKGPQAAGTRSATLFGLQKLIPLQGFAAWRTIALLLIVFTIGKGIADYFSTYLMAQVGQSAFYFWQFFVWRIGSNQVSVLIICNGGG